MKGPPNTGTLLARSRDNFVAITSANATIWLLAVVGQEYDANVTQFIDAYDCTELDAPIGTPDFEINLRMTG